MCSKDLPKMKMQGFEELFGLTEQDTSGHSVQKSEDIVEMPLSEMHAYKNHPFKVLDDESMAEFAESVKTYGVIHPGIVRKDPDGGYELISGHRRHMACKIAGLETMPVRVLELDDDEAAICMADANFYQREEILPYETAKAYRIKYESLKHQGKAGNGLTLDRIGETAGESGKTVQRFIRLSYLEDELLDMVDTKKLGIKQGIDISYLDRAAQVNVAEAIRRSGAVMSTEMSVKIREAAATSNLSLEKAFMILMEKKPAARKYVIGEEILGRYFNKNISDKELDEIIIGALNMYFEARGGKR